LNVVMLRQRAVRGAGIQHALQKNTGLQRDRDPHDIVAAVRQLHLGTAAQRCGALGFA
jgi:hypothetical protein